MSARVEHLRAAIVAIAVEVESGAAMACRFNPANQSKRAANYRASRAAQAAYIAIQLAAARTNQPGVQS